MTSCARSRSVHMLCLLVYVCCHMFVSCIYSLYLMCPPLRVWTSRNCAPFYMIAHAHYSLPLGTVSTMVAQLCANTFDF